MTSFGDKTKRVLEVVNAAPWGIQSDHVAIAISGTRATAACMLARLFWRGAVDRRKVGKAYVYTPRKPKA